MIGRPGTPARLSRIFGAAAVLLLVACGVSGCATAAAPSSTPAPSNSALPAAKQSPSTAASDPMDQAPSMPTPSPGATVDAAARAKAAAWLAGARLPPGAVKVESTPPGTSVDTEFQSWWCQPMAEEDAYWTIAGMDLGHAANWLRAHPSNGLRIVGPTYLAPDPELTNQSVSDFASPEAFEGMTFELASWGAHRAVIHLQVGVLAKASACASAPPGTELRTAGG